MSGRFRAHVGAELGEGPDWGAELECLGANHGPPLPGEIWLQVREANVWAMPPLTGR